MSQASYAAMLLVREAYKYPWESFEYPGATLDDIDHDEVLNTVKAGIDCGRLPQNTSLDVPVCLEKFGLMNNGTLNNAAMVLFANRELPTFTQCLVRMARFRGTNKMVFLDSQVAMGNIFQLMNAAMAFAFKHLCLVAWNTDHSLEREEHLTVPYKALREGLLNAFCHRSYRDPGGAVSLAIYDDRLEIENPCDLAPDFDVSTLKSEHRSHPHNPLIANVLYRRQFSESWGRGISLIMEQCAEVGLPEPEYRRGFGSLILIFKYESITRIPKIPGAPIDLQQFSPQMHAEIKTSNLKAEAADPTSTPQAEAADPTSIPQVETPAPSGHPQVLLTPMLLKLIKCIDLNMEFSHQELLENLGLKDRVNFRKNYLLPALKQGLLEFVYPDKPNSSKQKYRLTRLGKQTKGEI